jgi:transposase-like protein
VPWGWDAEGHNHELAIREGATENATVVKELLEDLVARGVNPDQKRLFVIDGSKALRTAINAVFGSQHPVQRCRAHKLRNVMDHLPKDQKDQVKSALRAAWRLDAKGGTARLKKLAEWLERDYPFCRRQLDRRAGRVFHDQPAGCGSLAASLFGHHQSHRESPCGCLYADSESLALA